MPNLMIFEKDEVKKVIPISSVYEARDFVKERKKELSDEVFVYSTINDQTKIENTINIR